MVTKKSNRAFRSKRATNSSESDAKTSYCPSDDSAVDGDLKEDHGPEEVPRIKSAKSLLAFNRSRTTYTKQARRKAGMGPSSLSQIFRAVESNPQLLGEYQPPHSTGTGQPSQVRIKPTNTVTPSPKNPVATAVPRKSILKTSTRRTGDAGDEEPPLRYRPGVKMEDSKFLYKPHVLPSMMNQRAITSVSIPKYCETKSVVGFLTPKLDSCSSIKDYGGEKNVIKRKHRWGRNVFLSDCGQFIIIHEFPAFDQNDGVGALGDWVMGHARVKKSKIIIYRSYGKVAIVNENRPQPQYGRSRKPIPIPGATQPDTESDRTNSLDDRPAHYLHTNPTQTQWATDPQIVAEWEFPRDEIISQVKVSMDVGKGTDGNV